MRIVSPSPPLRDQMARGWSWVEAKPKHPHWAPSAWIQHPGIAGRGGANFGFRCVATGFTPREVGP